MWAQKPVGLRP